MRDADWINIEPGDIGFDGGVGLSGFIIRHTTGIYGHCWVYHTDHGNGVWETIEAGPREGVIWRKRTRKPTKVVRLWRDEGERQRILEASEGCLGRAYGWGEIFRIALHILGIKVKGWADNKERMICSNHVATAAVASAPGLELTHPYKPEHIWPQRLATWCNWVVWTRDRNKEGRNG